MTTIHTSMGRAAFFDALERIYWKWREGLPTSTLATWPDIHWLDLDRLDALETVLTMVPDDKLDAGQRERATLAKRITATDTIAFDIIDSVNGRSPAWYLALSGETDAIAHLVSDKPFVRQQFEAFVTLLVTLDEPSRQPATIRRGPRNYTLDEQCEIVQRYLQQQDQITQEGFAEQYAISTRTLRRWIKTCGHK